MFLRSPSKLHANAGHEPRVLEHEAEEAFDFSPLPCFRHALAVVAASAEGLSAAAQAITHGKVSSIHMVATDAQGVRPASDLTVSAFAET